MIARTKTRTLTILNVAYPLARVGPDAVGGAEQVVTALDAALVRAGHRSLVIAAEGSTTSGTLLPSPHWTGTLDERTRQLAAERHRQTIVDALQHWPVDVVHLHGIDCHDYLPPPGVSVLVTLHLPPAWYPRELFACQRPATFLHCVSASQRRACPPCPFLLPDIENGVTDELFSRRHAKRRFAICLGRICPEKGFHLALDAAAQAEFPLLMGGAVYGYEAHEHYFQSEIMPRLDRSRRFLGPVGFRRKRRLLSAARCLVAPSLVPETSSLVAMEALACGTPVVAFPAGALAEIVEHGRTGFLVHNLNEMIDAIEASATLEPQLCRQAALSRFRLSRTIEKYFEIYTQLTDSGAKEVGNVRRGVDLPGPNSRGRCATV